MRLAIDIVARALLKGDLTFKMPHLLLNLSNQISHCSCRLIFVLISFEAESILIRLIMSFHMLSKRSSTRNDWHIHLVQKFSVRFNFGEI